MDYKYKVRRNCHNMTIRNPLQFEVNNIVPDSAQGKIDLSKVVAVRYDELPNFKGKITFIGQEEFSYETNMSMQMCFEDLFSKEYEQTWMEKYGETRLTEFE